MRYRYSLALLLLTGTACDHSTDPAVATSLVPSTSVNVAGVAGAPVSPPPSVVVKNQKGSPMAGIPVTFTVTSGGGTVTGASVTTGADGIATVGSWTFGTVAGQNILTASSPTLSSVTFTGIGSPGPAAAISKLSSDNQSTIVGTAVPNAPSVQVKDAYGNAVGNVAVTFTPSQGAGSVTGAARTTGADGVATAGSWILGTSVGTNILTVTAGTAPPVNFFATGIAGPATRIVTALGDGQIGRASARVPGLIAVRVTDAYNNGKPGTGVTFTVTAGGGSINGSATSSTDVDGYALFGGWILGPNPGPNSLTATASGVGSVTLTAIAVANECSLDAVHTIGATNSGDLALSDCVLDSGELIDYYGVQVAAPSSVEFRQSSSAFDAYLFVMTSDGFSLAEDDDDEDSPDPRMKVLMPAGSYRVGASSFAISRTGSYTISSSVKTESEENCEDVFLVNGITTSQTIATTDCVSSVNSTLHADVFVAKLRGGTAIRFKMSSTAVDSYLELYRLSTGLVATNDNISASTTDAEIVYTPPEDEYFFIVARTAVGSQTGAYSLAVANANASAKARTGDSPAAVTRSLHSHKGRLRLPWSK